MTCLRRTALSKRTRRANVAAWTDRVVTHIRVTDVNSQSVRPINVNANMGIENLVHVNNSVESVSTNVDTTIVQNLIAANDNAVVDGSHPRCLRRL